MAKKKEKVENNPSIDEIFGKQPESRLEIDPNTGVVEQVFDDPIDLDKQLFEKNHNRSQALRDLWFADLQKSLENTALVAAFVFDGKPQLALMYSPDLVSKGKNAGADIREGAKFIQGGGGGQPGLATAGGKNPDGIKDALEALIAVATK